jgi:hypothetical protein
VPRPDYRPWAGAFVCRSPASGPASRRWPSPTHTGPRWPSPRQTGRRPPSLAGVPQFPFSQVAAFGTNGEGAKVALTRRDGTKVAFTRDTTWRWPWPSQMRPGWPSHLGRQDQGAPSPSGTGPRWLPVGERDEGGFDSVDGVRVAFIKRNWDQGGLHWGGRDEVCLGQGKAGEVAFTRRRPRPGRRGGGGLTGRRVPYFRRILPTVVAMRPGFAEVRAPKWWGGGGLDQEHGMKVAFARKSGEMALTRETREGGLHQEDGMEVAFT